MTEDQETKDALQSARECMQQLNQNVFNDIRRRTMSAVNRRCIEKIESLSYDLATKEQSRKLGDLLSDMGVTVIFLRYAKIFRDDGCTLHYNIECLNLIKKVLWIFTDASAKLRVECGKTGMLREVTLELSSYRQSVANKCSQVPESVLSSLAILYNCAREEGNLRYFEEAETVQALLPYSSQHGCDLTKMYAVLALSYMTKETDKGSLGKSVIDFILEYLKKAVSSNDHRFEGFSAEELIHGLSHLGRNDNNKMLILESKWEALDIFAELMENGSQEEKIACAEAVRTLSFPKNNKIESHRKITQLLKEFEKSNEFIRKSAVGALWVLRTVSSREMPMRAVQADAAPFETEAFTSEVQSVVAVSRSDLANNSKQKHIMLSYNASSKAVVRKIYDRLLQLKFRVWIDEEMEASNDSKSMAVENSAVVLMCLSQKYKNCKNCQSEAQYAQVRNVPIIPVRVEPGYNPDGWLGLLQGGKLYFDLSTPTKFEDEFQNLVKHIGERGKHAEDNMVHGSDASMNQTIKKEEVNPVEKWTVQDVQQWADTLNLNAKILQDLDGKCLAFLRKIKETAPAIFYQYATGQMDFSHIRNLMDLSNAIDDLDITADP